MAPVGYQPQQSVLKPHWVQRQTACMRYISAPQRSHRVLSGLQTGSDPGDFTGVTGRGIGLAGASDTPGLSHDGVRRGSDPRLTPTQNILGS
jgi:hypothetical protein